MARSLASPRLSVLLLASAATLLGVAMGPVLYARLLFGPICSGHGSVFALHCPACYVTAALAAAALMAPYITRDSGSATTP